MPGETTNFKIKYALGADEVKKFPAEVSATGAKTIDEKLYEGNKVANAQVWGVLTARTSGTEYEPSASRAVEVRLALTFTGTAAGSAALAIEVGGVPIGSPKQSCVSGAEQELTDSFICPAGKKWKATVTLSNATSSAFQSTYLPL